MKKKQLDRDSEILTMAILGYTSQIAKIRLKIEGVQHKLEMLAKGKSGGQTAEAPQAGPQAVKTKRKLSPEGRRRIIEATKRRWAAVKAAKEAAEKQTQDKNKKTAKKKAARRKL